MIRVQSVSKYYGGKKALDAITCEIHKGEVVGLLGKNGAGKTTLLKILCGLLLPSEGHVWVDEIDGQSDPEALRQCIGFLPDRPPLYPDMTVLEMLRYAARLHGMSDKEALRRSDEVLTLTGLVDVKDDLIEWLSHGYRQRAGIAQAIVHGPKLVVLDEPISGLDPVQIVQMRTLIRSLKTEHTVLLSSHILSEISETCDRLLVLNQGRVVAEGTEAALLSGQDTDVRVTVKGELAQATAACAAAGAQVLSSTQTENIVSLRVRTSGNDGRERLVAALVQAGLGVRNISDDGTGLEGLFLRLTSSDAAPTSAPASPSQAGAA